MKALVVCALATLSASLVQAATSYAVAQPILNKNGCLACHALDKKVVGPSYVDVAAKYKGKADAPAYLAQKIKAGGVGVWGQVPMPPNPGISEADTKTVVDWLLSGAPAK